MKRKVTTDSAAFKSAIQLTTLLKFNNLEEITFFENHKPPNLSQDEAENLNNPNIEFVIKNSKKISPSPHGFTGKFYETCKEFAYTVS